MKRPREPPTGGNRMDIGRILPTEAAAILNVSPQFVRVAMQQGKLPIWDCSNTRTHTTITLITSNQKSTSRNSRG